MLRKEHTDQGYFWIKVDCVAGPACRPAMSSLARILGGEHRPKVGDLPVQEHLGSAETSHRTAGWVPVGAGILGNTRIYAEKNLSAGKSHLVSASDSWREGAGSILNEA